jgi:lipopolysaccharide transport system ATP-binding protein
MADDIVVRAEGLGKKYVIGHEVERERYVALRDVIARGGRNTWRMAADMAKGRVVVPGDTVEEFWALKDVNFEVKRGEVLGIIGRNGAGKSTLLKILSRITEPSEGRVTIKGRVASLLEVGTGFHPELTGRENIFLNGAVLGMTRAEIKRKFDEIVAFAETEKFLDTPVKRYSSGMYVRLAFAVAAHLEPEILVVDEVLSVGDAEFQKKCLGKMGEVASGGRTILFVSHNMGAVERVCRRGIILDHGRIRLDGSTRECVDTYQKHNASSEFTGKLHRDPTRGAKAYVQRVIFRDEHDRQTPNLRTWKRCAIELDIFSSCEIRDGSAVIYITSSDSKTLCLFSTRPDSAVAFPLAPGINRVRCEIPQLPLAAGIYGFGAGIAIPNVQWIENEAKLFNFEVIAQDVFNSGLPPSSERYLIAIPHQWRVYPGAEFEQEDAYEAPGTTR